MQKNLLLILAIALLLAFPLALSALAASPSPSPSPISEEVITENLKKRLQDTLDSTTSATSPSSFRGYVGQVKDVIKDTVIIQDQKGKMNVTISAQTTLLRSPGNKSIDLEDIRLEDYIIAIGNSVGKDELAGTRLIVSTTPLTSSNKTSGHSTLTKITKSTLTLANGTNLAINGKTVYKTSDSKSLVLADLSLGDTIIYTGTISEDTTTATVIMRLKSVPSSASPSPKN